MIWIIKIITRSIFNFVFLSKLVKLLKYLHIIFIYISTFVLNYRLIISMNNIVMERRFMLLFLLYGFLLVFILFFDNYLLYFILHIFWNIMFNLRIFYRRITKIFILKIFHNILLALIVYFTLKIFIEWLNIFIRFRQNLRKKISVVINKGILCISIIVKILR